jgi:hypothetical protein
MKKLAILLFFWSLFLSVTAENKDGNYFEINLASVGEKLYPRLLLEGRESLSPTSNFGLWCLIEYASLPYMPNSWKEQGYIIEDIYGLNLKAGLSCGSQNNKLIVGVGYSSNKSYFGPLLGAEFSGRHWQLQALGLYATNTSYHSHYSAEEEIVPRVYICGFDPNSWYLIKGLYSISDCADVGFISERFYGTGLTSEYNLGLVRFKFMFGRELEFKENVFQFGLIMKI